MDAIDGIGFRFIGPDGHGYLRPPRSGANVITRGFEGPAEGTDAATPAPSTEAEAVVNVPAPSDDTLVSAGAPHAPSAAAVDGRNQRRGRPYAHNRGYQAYDDVAPDNFALSGYGRGYPVPRGPQGRGFRYRGSSRGGRGGRPGRGGRIGGFTFILFII